MVPHSASPYLQMLFFGGGGVGGVSFRMTSFSLSRVYVELQPANSQTERLSAEGFVCSSLFAGRSAT